MGASQRSLRVVLLLRSARVPKWTATLAAALMNTDGIEVRALVVGDEACSPNARTRPPAAWRCPDLVDLADFVPGLPIDPYEAAAAGSSGPFGMLGVAVTSSLATEVFAARGSEFPLGVWYSPEFDETGESAGSQDRDDDADWRRHENLAVTVRATAGPGAPDRIVAVAEIPLESLYVGRNRVQAAWSAGSLIFAAIEHVLEENPSGTGSKSVPRDVKARPDAAVDGRLRFSGRHGRGWYVTRLARSSVRRAAFKRQWLLAYQFGDQRSLAPREDTHFAVPPLDRYWADPMVVFVDGEHHIFFEEFTYRRGQRAHLYDAAGGGRSRR